MRAVILQSNYLPWRGYFDLVQSADVFVYYDEVQYTKNDWRNRNRICSKNGVHWLTIPVSRTAVKSKVSEVLLPDNGWQDNHYKTLYYSYRPARWFSQIEPFIDEVYRRRKWVRLSELNRFCIEWISGVLGLRTRFLDSRDFDLSGGRVERLVGLLRQIGASEYLTGPSAKDYLAGSDALFAAAGVRLIFKSYDGYPDYPQLATPFQPAVSIVDLLANVDVKDCARYMTAAQG